MYFGSLDAPGASVHDLDRRERIRRVLSIDTDAAEIVVVDEPMRLCNGEIATRTLKFQAVWPIFVDVRPDRINRPVLFHCHGRRD